MFESIHGGKRWCCVVVVLAASGCLPADEERLASDKTTFIPNHHLFLLFTSSNFIQRISAFRSPAAQGLQGVPGPPNDPLCPCATTIISVACTSSTSVVSMDLPMESHPQTVKNAHWIVALDSSCGTWLTLQSSRAPDVAKQAKPCDYELVPDIKT